MKKKALKAIWDDSSSSEDKEVTNKEVSNFTLMAVGEVVIELFNKDLNFDELSNVFHELFDECRVISRKFNLLKKEHALLVSKFDSLKLNTLSFSPCSKCEHLETLKKENLLLKETLDKFKVSSKTLDMILANKGHIHKKSGVRFASGSHRNPTTFIKGPTLHVLPHTKCNFCCKPRHVVYKCLFKKLSLHKLIWVPKGTINNLM
ncbi:unnamed protein product [Musa textilis]